LLSSRVPRGDDLKLGQFEITFRAQPLPKQFIDSAEIQLCRQHRLFRLLDILLRNSQPVLRLAQPLLGGRNRGVS
jgi:hypothetical protein